MKQSKTTAIVLSRINYGETDRIITVITPDHGKMRLMARGVRAIKSKLAGGIELFSINDISFIRGRGEVSTLTSSRLKRNFGDILTDINRVQLGYEILRTVNKNTEDETESDFFELLESALKSLNDLHVEVEITRVWFMAHLLEVSGHAPNLVYDDQGQSLKESGVYSFNNDAMAFSYQTSGKYTANDIKFLRLVFSARDTKILAKVNRAENYCTKLLPLLNLMHLSHLSR